MRLKHQKTPHFKYIKQHLAQNTAKFKKIIDTIKQILYNQNIDQNALDL